MPVFVTSNIKKSVRMFRNCTSLVIDPGDYVFDSLENGSEMFIECSSMTKVTSIKCPKMTTGSKMFYNCTGIQTVGRVEFPIADNFTFGFYGCSSLQTIDSIFMPKVWSAWRIFEGCNNLVSIPIFDTSNFGTCDNLFANCYKLNIDIGQFNFSNATKIEQLCFNCKAITTVSGLNAPKVTTASPNIFSGCTNLTTVGDVILPNNPNAAGLFHSCTSLTTVGNVNISKSSRVDILYGCTNLQTIGYVDASAATAGTTALFSGFSKLTSVGNIKLLAAADISNTFKGCTSS